MRRRAEQTERFCRSGKTRPRWNGCQRQTERLLPFRGDPRSFPKLPTFPRVFHLSPPPQFPDADSSGALLPPPDSWATAGLTESRPFARPDPSRIPEQPVFQKLFSPSHLGCWKRGRSVPGRRKKHGRCARARGHVRGKKREVCCRLRVKGLPDPLSIVLITASRWCRHQPRKELP